MEEKPDKNIEDRLRYILSLVNEWLKFAEGKNAALMAASSALIFGLITVIGQSPKLALAFVIYLYVVILFLGIGGIVCLISFIPQLEIPWLLSSPEKTERDNLLFYGNIVKYDPPSYLTLLYQQSEIDPSKIDPFAEDYAEQIIINSRIAMYKYRSFNVGIWLTLTGLITPIGILVLYLIRKKQSV